MPEDFKIERSKLAFLKGEVYALYYAARDPRTPLIAKVLAVLLVGYVISPIDIIPDFIPLAGYLDELIIVPYAVKGILKLVPPEVMAEARARGVIASGKARKIGRVAATLFAFIFLTVFIFLGFIIWGLVRLFTS